MKQKKTNDKHLMQVFRDDASSLYRLSCGNERLTISHADFELFVLGLVHVGLANGVVSRSRLLGLLNAPPWEDLNNS